MSAIRILIVDDHPVVRHGIRSLLSNHADFEVVGEAASVSATLELIAQLKPDIVLLDIRLAGESGLSLLNRIEPFKTKVVILTSFDDEEHVRVALQGGAHGFILKSVSDEMLCGAIRTIHEGGQVLSSQIARQMAQHLSADDALAPAYDTLEFDDEEQRIIRLLIEGASNDQMAADLYMSVASVKRKLRNIFTKLRVQNRAQAAAVIVQRNLI
ncbi:MAG: response regulator transcription factor [Anaerolineae bacterium]